MDFKTPLHGTRAMYAINAAIYTTIFFFIFKQKNALIIIGTYIIVIILSQIVYPKKNGKTENDKQDVQELPK